MSVNFAAVGEIESAVGALTLQDVIPPDTFATIFPEAPEDNGETDG